MKTVWWPETSYLALQVRQLMPNYRTPYHQNPLSYILRILWLAKVKNDLLAFFPGQNKVAGQKGWGEGGLYFNVLWQSFGSSSKLILCNNPRGILHEDIWTNILCQSFFCVLTWVYEPPQLVNFHCSPIFKSCSDRQLKLQKFNSEMNGWMVCFLQVRKSETWYM